MSVKHTSLLVVLCLLVSLTGIASAQTLSNANLMGYWQFEEASGSTAWDSSTNLINGTLTPSGIEMGVEGRWGKGFYFSQDGTNGWINLGTNAISALTNSLTVSFWVKKQTTGWATVINACNVVDSNGLREISWAVNAHDGAQHAAWRSDTLLGLKPNGTTALDDFEWHHVVGVYDRGVGFSIYVDGALDVFGANANGPLATNYQINIGSFLDSNDQSMYIGFLDDVAVFDGALDTNEIYCAYTGGVAALIGDPSQPAGTNVPVELIAWYEFEERLGATNAYDSSGNNLDGDINTDVGLDQYGKFGRSFYFNQNSLSQIDVPTNRLLDISGPITVAAWFMTSSLQYKDIVSYDNLTNNISWNMGLGNLSSNGWASMRMQYKGSGTTLINETPPYVANDRQWHHCVWTYDRFVSENKVYFDGELAVTHIHNINPLDTAGNRRLVIGGQAGGGNNWQGWIDDVAVWNGVLSSNEIYTMYTGGVYALEGVPIPPEKEPELIGWWKLNELSGTNMYDSWTNEIHGYATDTNITEYAAGKFGGALKLVRATTPAGSHLDLGTNAAIYLPGPMTLTVWADITDGYTWPQGIAMVGRDGGNRYWKLYSESGLKFKIDGIGTEAVIATDYGIGDGVWDFFTAVYDRQGGEMRITVDNDNTNYTGINVLSATPNIKDSGVLWPNLRLGGGIAQNGLGGYMDEVSLWNGVLSSNDLYTCYTGGVAALLGLPPDPPYVPNLVAWWKLDEESGTIAYDQSTNNVEGTNMSGITVGQPGKFGTSYYFDGTTNGWIDFGFSNAVSLSPSPLTIVAWVNHTMGSGSKAILACDWYDPSTNKWFENWKLDVLDAGAKINWANRGNVAGGVGVNDGNWHLITAVQDRYGAVPRTHLYVDDQLVGTADDNGGAAFANPGQILAMGSRGGIGNTFLGYIDDVAVFDGPLSSNDVEYIYNYGLDEFFLPTPKGSVVILR